MVPCSRAASIALSAAPTSLAEIDTPPAASIPSASAPSIATTYGCVNCIDASPAVRTSPTAVSLGAVLHTPSGSSCELS